MLVWMCDIMTCSHKNPHFSNMYLYTLKTLHEVLSYYGSAPLATICRVYISGGEPNQSNKLKKLKTLINQKTPQNHLSYKFG